MCSEREEERKHESDCVRARSLSLALVFLRSLCSFLASFYLVADQSHVFLLPLSSIILFRNLFSLLAPLRLRMHMHILKLGPARYGQLRPLSGLDRYATCNSYFHSICQD